jgi:hypothetical protein
MKLEFLNLDNMEEIEYGIDGYPANTLENVKLSSKHLSIATVLILMEY